MSGVDGKASALLHWIVVGAGRGELFEIRAEDAMEAVRTAFLGAGGGGGIFDVVTSREGRSDVVSVFPGDGKPLVGAGKPFTIETAEKIKAHLLNNAKPALRLRLIAEPPLVVVALSPAIIEHFLDRFAATETERRERKQRLVGRLTEMLQPYQGLVVTSAVNPAERKPALVKVHARGISLFTLIRLTRALQETAADMLSKGLSQNEFLAGRGDRSVIRGVS